MLSCIFHPADFLHLHHRLHSNLVHYDLRAPDITFAIHLTAVWNPEYIDLEFWKTESVAKNGKRSI